MSSDVDEQDQAEALPSGGEVVFDFQHRLFSIDGCVFRRPDDGAEIALYVPMGDVVAALPVHQLAQEFEIEPGTEDFRLLELVKTALEHVRQVRPGDSIPNEVLNGTTPWMVEDKYLELALARFVLQLVAWHAGKKLNEPATDQLIGEAQKAAGGGKLAAAKAAMAEFLGFENNAERRLADALEQLTQEWAYIEALRDKIEGIKRIHGALKSNYDKARKERSLLESITRCTTLLEQPMKDIFSRLSRLDAETRDIAATMGSLEAKIVLIRKVRDQLRRDFVRWEDLIAAWDFHLGGEDDKTVDQMVRETYAFAAKHYAQADNW